MLLHLILMSHGILITFQADILIFQLEANSDVRVLFGEITHLYDPRIRKMSARGLYRNVNSMFDSGPQFNCHCDVDSENTMQWSVEC